MLGTYPMREVQGVKVLELPKRVTGLQNGEELEMVLEDLLSEGVRNVVLDFRRSAISTPSFLVHWSESTFGTSAGTRD